MNKITRGLGFTIVELLVVIVVIGILAAITVISYTGISSKAIAASLQADLTNASQKLKVFQLREDNPSGNFPETLNCNIADSSTNLCLKTSGSNSFEGGYSFDNLVSPKTFRLTGTNGLIVYRITNDSSPIAVATTPITAIGDIDGLAVIGSVLTAGVITPPSATVDYQWKILDGGNYVDISGATSSTYTITGGDWGKSIVVVATGKGAYSGTQMSNVINGVTMPIISVADISGTARVGSVLTAGAITPSSAYGGGVRYQWQRGDSLSGDYADIVGASLESYALGNDDWGRFIKLKVTGIEPFSGVQVSNPTSYISKPIGMGPITGRAMIGSTLTAGAIDPPSAYVHYQWQKSDAADGVYINITTGQSSSYTPGTSSRGKYLRVGVLGSPPFSDTYTYSAPTTAIGPVDPNWIDGIYGTVLYGKYVYNVDVSASTYTWANRNTGCATGGRSPTLTELQAIYTGKVTYGNNFQAGRYWSSTEIDSTTASYLDFKYNTTGNASKTLLRYIRCVADF